MNILGISAFYHDSAACLVRDGEIIAAAQEERFTRKKHDPGFPHRAIDYCLREGQIELKDVRHLVFYDKPLVKFERLLETYLAFAPRGVQSFVAAMPVWLKEKLLLKSLLQKEFLQHAPDLTTSSLPQILFSEHHESHAASAFFPSPYEKAVVLCMDGVGAWANPVSAVVMGLAVSGMHYTAMAATYFIRAGKPGLADLRTMRAAQRFSG